MGVTIPGKFKSIQFGSNLIIIIIILVISTIIGCAGGNDPSEGFYDSFGTEEQHHRIATTHLAVLAVGDWDTYKEALKPKYKLTSEDALGEVLPITSRTNHARLKATALAVKLAGNFGATTGYQEKKTVDKSTVITGANPSVSGSSETTATKQNKESWGPGDLQKVPSGAAPDLDKVQRLLDKVNLNDIGTDPLLKYLTATALYQEVQMLQRYLDHTPKYGDYQQYIVRMQLTLMPTTRNQPYDAYSDISFFLKPTADVDTKETNCGPFEQQPIIVPLVITDNLEAAFSQASNDNQSRIALGLLATIGRLGGSVDFEHVSRVLREYAGRQYNSLFTVGRLSANTLRVRLGATRSGEDKYTMMTRTHQITVLLLVPKKEVSKHSTPVTVVSKTFFRNASTGEVPDTRTLASSWRYGRRLVRAWAEANHVGYWDRQNRVTKALTRELLELVSKNDYTGFVKKLNCMVMYGPIECVAQCLEHECGIRGQGYDSLWIDLQDVRAGSRYAADTFWLDQVTIPAPFIDPNQTAILYDYEAKGIAQVILLNVKGIPPTVTAYFHVGSKDEKKWAAIAHAISKTDKALSLTFRSLKRFDVTPTDFNNVKLYICKKASDKCPGDDLIREMTLIYKPTPDPPSEPFHVSANYKRLIVDANNSSEVVLTIKVNETVENMTLEVENAMFNASPKPVSEVLAKEGPNSLTLVNILPYSIVTIYRKLNDKRFGEPLLLVPLPPAAKKP